MADSKITALASIGTGTDPANDPLVIVDVSDTSMAASGTTKKVTLNNLLASSPTATLASATITGDLTVDTNVLKVDTTNNRVGIGTASPASGYSLDILGAAVGGLRVSSNNYPNLVIDSANSNGALIYIQEGGTTQARIGHLTTVTGLQFSGNNGTAATNVHYYIDNTGISTWQNVGGVAGTAMTLNSTGLGVGVGPSYNIHARGTTNGRIQVEGASGFGMVFIQGSSGNTAQLQLNSSGGTGRRFNLYSDPTGFFGISDETAVATRLTIDSSGNVGVGVTPTQKLTVLTNVGVSAITATAADDRLIFTENMASANLGSQIVWKTASSGNAYASIGITNGAAGNNGSLIFSTSSSIFGSNNVERVRIKPTGQVRFFPLAADPAGAETGDVYYNSTSNKLKCYNGTSWNDLF